VEVVASLSQGRTAAAQCGLFTHKSVPVIFEPPCSSTIRTQEKAARLHASIHGKVCIIRHKRDRRRITQLELSDNKEHKWKRLR